MKMGIDRIWEWIQLAQDRFQWWAKKIMEIRAYKRHLPDYQLLKERSPSFS
jgi:hypothetical protein